MKDLAPKLRKFLPWIALVVFGVAAVMVVRAVREHGLSAVLEALKAIPAGNLLVAFLLAAASYLTLTLVDLVALRATGVRLPWRQVAFASFVALSVGHTAGLAVFSSGTLRYRVYASFGVSEGDVARMILHCAATVAAGLLTLAGFGGLARPDGLAEFLHVAPTTVRSLAVAALALVSAWLLAAAFVRRPLRIQRFELRFPSLPYALLQVALGTLNFTLVAAVLHRLLGDDLEVGFLAFAGFYAAANAASILSHVPGGLGVIEALVLAVASGPQTLGALVAFRVVYYFVPFALGGLAYLVWSRRQSVAAPAPAVTDEGTPARREAREGPARVPRPAPRGESGSPEAKPSGR